MDELADQIEDFEGECTDRLNTFIDSFTFENGCLGYVNYHEGRSVLSRKGIRLYERYRDRLFAIGSRRFPGHELTVESDILADDEECEGG